MSDWKSRATKVASNSAAGWRSRATPVAKKPVVEEKPEISQLESGAYGLAQGASMGYSDEALAALKAAGETFSDFDVSKLPERYRQKRDIERKNIELARQANPKTFMGTEIAGSIGTALVPGLGAAKLGKTMALGAAQALGTSEADLTKGEIGEAAKDAGIGLGVGALGHGIAKGAGKLMSASNPKNISKVYLGLPDQAYDRLIKDPSGVKSALSKSNDFYGLPKIAERVAGRVDDLAEEAVSGSQAARETLKFENTKIPQQKLREKLLSRLQMMKDDEGRIPYEGYNHAKNVINDQLKKLPKGEISAPIRDKATGRIIKTAKRMPDPDLTGTEAMDRIREIRNSLDWTPTTGKIDSKSQYVLKQTQKDLDQILKAESPAYTGMMKDTAEAAQLLQKAKTLGRDEQGVMNFVGSMDKAGRKFKADVLAELDKRFGDTLSQDALNAIAARVIDRASTAGSRAVNIGTKIGEAIGELFPGNVAKKLLGAAGAMTGGAVDKFGRKMAIPIVEQSAKISRAIEQGKITGPAKKALQKALKKGPQNAALTFQLLSRSNPELLNTLESEEP